MHSPYRTLALAAFIVPLGCDSGEEGADEQCPAGSGSVFVQNGPNGPGCYCPVGTVPNATGSQCVTGDACGPYRRSDGAGDCVDIDECAEGTSGCSEFAD